MTAPALVAQEQTIARQRALVEELDFSGSREAAARARADLTDMCERLSAMRRDERGAAIAARERGFPDPDDDHDDDHMDDVMRTCPL